VACPEVWEALQAATQLQRLVSMTLTDHEELFWLDQVTTIIDLKQSICFYIKFVFNTS
jgi:alpha-D-ribose 1-methylphosphonate 5-triphosphate synthase subunit PhnH